jgi:hypothetical protein
MTTEENLIDYKLMRMEIDVTIQTLRQYPELEISYALDKFEEILNRYKLEL